MADTSHVERLHRRFAYMEALAGERLHKPELVDRLDVSRSTVDRAIRELEDAGFVEKGRGGYTTTTAGRLAFERHRRHRREVTSLDAAEPVLEALPADTSLDIEAVVGAEPILATEPAPYEPREHVAETLREAETYRALLPALPDPKQLRLLYEHVVTREQPATLVVSPDLMETVREELPVRLPAMVETGRFSLLVGDVPEYGVVSTTAEEGQQTSILAFGSQGGLHGILANTKTEASDWADQLFEEYGGAATDVTAEFEEGEDTPADGGVTVATQTETVDTGVESRLVELEREGFVRVDREFLAGRAVADPTTAWRAGLDIAEVQAGYAVERRNDDGPLHQEVLEHLRTGTNCALVGPPGSGKSTLCKQVACEWYRDGGTVLYRESNTGRAFESVDDLVATVRATDGDVLVVVEDAVRPESATVFEAMEHLSEDQVTFLLDAREREWQDPPGSIDVDWDPGRNVDRSVPMPSLSRGDCGRLARRFEQTLDRSVDVSLDDLLSDVRQQRRDDDAAPGELLLVLHRLSLYADPVADDVTNLEEEVAAVYDDLAAAGDEPLDVGLAANLLNAAGLELRESLLSAAVPDDEQQAVADALAVLRDRVLFEQGDGSFRAVHESWSTAFLDHVLAAEGEAVASDRFARVLTTVLSLAEEPARRERITDATGEDPLVDAEPGSWVETVVERVATLGHERPRLAPLFGEPVDLDTTLPAACSETTRADVREELGRMLVEGGYYDRARDLFHRHRDWAAEQDRPEYEVEALRQLSVVERIQGEYDQAQEYVERALDLAADLDSERQEAACRRELGEILKYRGEYDQARARLQESLTRYRDIDHRRGESYALNTLGEVSRRKAEYDQAHEYYEQSLAIKRELGDRNGESTTLNNLGLVARRQGDYEQARCYLEESLAIDRQLGNRRGQALSLGNLGLICRRLGEYNRAETHLTRSLDIQREISYRKGVTQVLNNLGELARDRGEYDRAQEYYEQSLEIRLELDDEPGAASVLANLGLVAFRRGKYDRALEYHEESLGIHERLDNEQGKALNHLHIGLVAHLRGDYDRARERYERSLDLAREIGDSRSELYALTRLGDVCHRQGTTDEAESHLTESLDTARDLGNPKWVADSLRYLGTLARETGAIERARDRLEEALTVASEECGSLVVAQVHLERARLAVAEGEHTTARDHVDTAHDAFVEMGATHWIGRCLAVEGQIAEMAGDHQRARARWQTALATFEVVGAPRETLDVLQSLVDHYRADGDTERTSAALAHAERVLARLPDSAVADSEEWIREHRVVLDGE